VLTSSQSGSFFPKWARTQVRTNRPAGVNRRAVPPTETALLSFQIAQPIFKIGQKGS
jgi:hypothetical protein